MYKGLIQNTNQAKIKFINPIGGTTTLDENYEPVNVPEPEIITTGNFIDLSPSEISARQQIQDDSRHKLVIQDTVENRTIQASWLANVDNVDYQITGRPRKPQFSNGWITVYLKDKGV